MTAMATTTPARIRVTEARRAASVAIEPTSNRRLKLAAACYIGMVALVVLSVMAVRVLPAWPVAAAFVIGMTALVASLHPSIRVTSRAH